MSTLIDPKQKITVVLADNQNFWSDNNGSCILFRSDDPNKKSVLTVTKDAGDLPVYEICIGVVSRKIEANFEGKTKKKFDAGELLGQLQELQSVGSVKPPIIVALADKQTYWASQNCSRNSETTAKVPSKGVELSRFTGIVSKQLVYEDDPVAYNDAIFSLSRGTLIYAKEVYTKDPLMYDDNVDNGVIVKNTHRVQASNMLKEDVNLVVARVEASIDPGFILAIADAERKSATENRTPIRQQVINACLGRLDTLRIDDSMIYEAEEEQAEIIKTPKRA